MTVTGTTLGSVHYFSPEQARGDEVTGASDVYALAIVLFEMLTGRRPFEGDSAAAVALRRLNEDAPRPSSLGSPAPRQPRGDPHARPRSRRRRSLPRRRRVRRGAARLAPRSRRARSRRSPAARRGRRAATPPSGEPTVYVPPRVTRPADRAPVAPPPRRPVTPYPRARERDRDGQPWWIWLLAVLAVVLLGAIGFLAAQLLGRDADADAEPQRAAGDGSRLRGRGAHRRCAPRRTRSTSTSRRDARHPTTSRRTASSAASRRPARSRRAGSTLVAYVSSGADAVAVPRLRGQTRGPGAVDARAARPARRRDHSRGGPVDPGRAR